EGRVFLKKGKDVSVRRFHPWVFSGAIEKTDGDVDDGGWVEIQDNAKKTLGFGHFQKGSIAVRILSFESAPPSKTFYEERISAALKARRTSGLPSPETNCFRIIHGEGDGLPGLIIDYYDGVAVIQSHSPGMHRDRSAIADALRKAWNEVTAVYYRSKGTLPGRLRDETADEYLFGNAPVPHPVIENGCRFFVNWEEGQKTGFFLDQR